MTRVLVALSPRMYREAVALSIHRGRPGLDVRLSPPEEAEAEISRFRPHLLVHNDTAPITGVALAVVPLRVEVCYSDGMEARLGEDGTVSEARDMSVEDLLLAVDRAAEAAGAG